MAFRVEFPNHDMPNIDDLYWRSVVLWQTDGNAWQRGPWDRRAVGYNSELQDEFLRWLGLDEFGAWAHAVGLVIGGLGIIVSIALTTWLAPRLRKSLHRSREDRAYRRLLATCARAGMPRLSSEGPQARVARRLPAAAEALGNGVNAWLDFRYGAPGIGVRDARQRLLKAARQR